MKKIVILFMALLGICCLLCGCDKNSDSNNSTEETSNIAEEKGLKNGVYYMNNNMLQSCIVVTDSNIFFFKEKQQFSGKIYEYTASETTINAKNSYSEITISIAKDSLIYDNDTYTLRQEKDWFSEKLGIEVITDPYVYYYALSDDDINSARQAATEYYNNAFFVQDIISIELSEYIEDYEYSSYISETERFSPGNVILFDVITTTFSDDNLAYEDYRSITLTRNTKDSEWIVTNEGR